MIFQPHRDADKRKNSAVELIKILLSIKNPNVVTEHIRELIGTLLWKMTEADGKYNTRYKTSGALECRDKSRLRHEHVYQRSKMIDALLMAKPESIEAILSDAIGCTVTIDEHLRLNKFDDEYGWERYRLAGLEVFDMVSKERKV